jgi:hypothetical protein
VVETGSGEVTGRGAGVDPETGALLIQSEHGPLEHIDSGEVIRCRVL